MARMAGSGHELLTPAEMARADRLAVEQGVPLDTLTRRAGRAVARAIRARVAPVRTLVLVGPGHNGADGIHAARDLQRAGWPVAVAAWSAQSVPWHGVSLPFRPQEVARADLVIDAVFGAGLNKQLPTEVEAALRAARLVVAVDVPSGVDGQTGATWGAAPAAAFTVTFFRRKPGHFLLPGRDLCGEVVLADIGFPPGVLEALAPCTVHNGPWLWTIPRPGAAAHKYTRGHVTVLGGAAMTGAARLAAMAARHGGAGMVTIAATGGGDIYRAGEPGTIVSDAPLAALLEDQRRTVWVCGPGLGAEAARAALPVLLSPVLLSPVLLSSHRQVVVDADALTICAGAPELLRGAAVLTPHAGEFARVFGDPGPDRMQAARRAAARTGAVVLLKGSDTIVAAPDGRAAINGSAPPWLATAGAGDVLAGLIAAYLAQGLPAWEAACAAAWVHGRAARAAGEGMVVEDLLAALRQAAAAASVAG